MQLTRKSDYFRAMKSKDNNVILKMYTNVFKHNDYTYFQQS